MTFVAGKLISDCGIMDTFVEFGIDLLKMEFGKGYVTTVAIQTGIDGFEFGFAVMRPFFIIGGMTVRTLEFPVHSPGHEDSIQNIVRIHQPFFVLPRVGVIKRIVVSRMAFQALCPSVFRLVLRKSG
jgi:hypothetical protein